MPKAARAETTQRDYGSDDYWIGRFARRRRDDDDETDEWLLTWLQLRELLLGDLLPSGAVVCDLGCGISALALDLLRDRGDTRVVGLDIAPAAVAHQRAAQRSRLQNGERAAERATFEVADVTMVPLPRDDNCAEYDVCIDKSTTDGMLCDTKRGAERVRRMYAHVGAALAPAATVCVCSWRDPEEEGLAWLTDLVLGGLRSGGTACSDDEEGTVCSWAVDVHTLVRTNGARGPHVYLLRRRMCRRSARCRTRTKRARAEEEASEEEGELRLRLHVHDVDDDM
jgi:hypothetical protein